MSGGRVVILGPTGRNVAAGMSGGVAYVLDLDPGLVNRELVDLEPLDHEDTGFLLDVVGRHGEETGSTVAETLLADWSAATDRFTKIMPRDYRRVLDAGLRAERDGVNLLDEIMEASRG
jgi:glutamate synthase (NADPH/NADH) large chain